MSVWLCMPSKRRPEECRERLYEWRDRGYKVLLQRDPGDHIEIAHIQRPYSGYAEAVNYLIRDVLANEPFAEWFVCAGDDMLPDPHKSADEIANECSEYFAKLNADKPAPFALAHRGDAVELRTWGVMQPTGDRWLVNGPGTTPGSECVAGSPWMGREFCRRMYRGNGPLCEEYFHCGEDEELQEVAMMLGVFWQRPDLTQHHDHWGRPKANERLAPASRMPAFLARANSREEWRKYKETFAARKAAGFPGHEPI